MNDLAQHYALLLGLRDDWLVQSVDLDLDDQRVEIRLDHNPECKCQPAQKLTLLPRRRGFEVKPITRITGLNDYRLKSVGSGFLATD